MAVYTITLAGDEGSTKSIDKLYAQVSFGKAYFYDNYAAASRGDATGYLTRITPPQWPSGLKEFNGYYDESNNLSIRANGNILRYGFDTGAIYPSAGTWYASWNSLIPIVRIVQTSGVTIGTPEIYLNPDDSKFYLDDGFEVEFSNDSQIVKPTKEKWKFLGCYVTNSVNSTQVIDEYGRPTEAFSSLSPTVESPISIYPQFVQVSYKVTVQHGSGSSPTATVFYAKKGETGSGRFYSDDQCTHQTTGITLPQKELYAWQGCWSASTTTATGSKQYIDSNGNFTSYLIELAITSDKTLPYGNIWTQVSYKLALNGTGWTFNTSAYYTHKTNGNVYSDWLCATSALSSVAIPSRPGYRFLGYNSKSDGSGVLYVNGSGIVQSSLNTLKATATLYAQGRAATYTLTLDANGGTGGTSLYYDATSGDTAFFGTASSVVTSVTPPTYTGNAFLGYFTEQAGGIQVIDASGNILTSWTPSVNGTVYAHWGIEVSIVDIDAGEGETEGTTRFWYRMTTGKFYSDSELTQEISSISPPSKNLFNLNGIYTEGNVLAVNAAGVIQPGFVPSEEFVYLHATFTRRCYQTKLAHGSASSSVNAIYRAPGGSTWYAEDTLTTPISNVGVPTLTGYTFGGYRYGNTTVVSSAGVILSAASVDEDYTAVAVWTARTYTLTFNGNGATPSFASKPVTFGSAIGNLPTVSISGRRFESWQIDGDDIKSTDVWKIDANKTAVAKWKDNFGGLTDWFNLSNNYLMLVGSESGEGRKVTNLWNGALEQGPGLVNPVCTYRVKSKGIVTIRLGKAFSSGCFITGFEYKTGADREPLLVVSGTANEGSDAINLYDVTFLVDPDHVAQDPFGAVSGGGELVELTSSATCDPVVPYENNRPCASDVVHGRKTVSGRNAAYFGENPPTFLNSFIDSGVPKSESDVDFTTYAFTAEREI